jgi:hypothetical protein
MSVPMYSMTIHSSIEMNDTKPILLWAWLKGGCLKQSLSLKPMTRRIVIANMTI